MRFHERMQFRNLLYSPERLTLHKHQAVIETKLSQHSED